MSQNPETKLWSALRDGTMAMDVHWTRVEAWSLPGVPDVNGCVWNLVHHLSSNRLYFLSGLNLAKRLMDGDEGNYDGWIDMPTDYDGWRKVLGQLTSREVRLDFQPK